MEALAGLEDRTGLDRAYADRKGVYEADTLYIAGTRDLQDAWDDLKIPIRATSQAQRYKDASMVLDANPQLTRVVGHSLAGSIALDMQQKNPNLHTVTYGRLC